MANPFDQFDAPTPSSRSTAGAATNPFDTFDPPPASDSLTDQALSAVNGLAGFASRATPQGAAAYAAQRALTPSAPQVEHPDLETVANLPIPGALDPGMTFGKAMAAKFGPMFTSEPDEIERIILKNVPGTTATKDAMGNRMIDYNGKRYYIDMPGVTGMDIARTAGPAMIGVPLTAAAAAAAPVLGAGALGTAALIGGASGVSSLAEDALADLAGGEGGLKAGKAALATVLGGGGQFLLGKAMPKVTQRAALEGLGLDDIFSGGNLTDKGLALFRRAGVDPEMFTPQQMQSVVSGLRSNMVDQTAADAIQQGARQQVAGDLRVPMTRGQITGNEAQLIAEDQMRQGARGAPAARVLRDFGEGQGADAQTAVDTTRRGLTSALDPMAPSEVGNAVGGAFEQAGQRLSRARDAAYTATFRQPGEFDPNAFRNVGTYIQEQLSDPLRARGAVILDESLTPNAVRAFEEAKGVAFGPRANRAMTADAIRETPEPTPVTMQDLDRTRRVMLAAKDAAYRNNPADGRAASAVVKAFDDRIEAAMRAGLFDGDQRTLDLLLGSRQLHALWRERFGKQRDNMGLVNGFINTAAKEGRSGQDLFNAIYGAGQLGNRSGSRAMMEHLTRTLGDNPEAMMALREGAINRILGGVDSAGVDKATYGKMAKGIEQAMSGPGREVFDALFTGAERQQVQQLGYALRTLAETMNKRNPSGTSYPLVNALRKMTGGALGGIVGGVLGAKTGMPWAGEALAAAGVGTGKLIQDQIAAMTARRATSYAPGVSRAPVSQWLRSAVALPTLEAPPALDRSLPALRASGGRVGFDAGGAPDPLSAIDRFGDVLRGLRASDTSPHSNYGSAPPLQLAPYPIYYLPKMPDGVSAPSTGIGATGTGTGGISSAGTPASGVSASTPSFGASAGPPFYEAPATAPDGVGSTSTTTGSSPQTGVNSTSNSPGMVATMAALGLVSPVPGVIGLANMAAPAVNQMSTISVPGVATNQIGVPGVSIGDTLANMATQTNNAVAAGVGTGNNAGQPGQANQAGQANNVGPTPGIGMATQTAQQAGVGGVGVGSGSTAAPGDPTADSGTDSGTWARGGHVVRRYVRPKRYAGGRR